MGLCRNHRATSYGVLAALIVASFANMRAMAYPVIDANDILVSNDGLIYDYTRSGTLIQQIPVPYPDGYAQRPSGIAT